MPGTYLLTCKLASAMFFAAQHHGVFYMQTYGVGLVPLCRHAAHPLMPRMWPRLDRVQRISNKLRTVSTQGGVSMRHLVQESGANMTVKGSGASSGGSTAAAGRRAIRCKQTPCASVSAGGQAAVFASCAGPPCAVRGHAMCVQQVYVYADPQKFKIMHVIASGNARHRVRQLVTATAACAAHAQLNLRQVMT